MSRNPYAHPEPEVDELPAAHRVSALAVSSLVASLLCCPPMGLIGAVLGVAALPGIARSGGQLGGRSLALAGIVAGLITTMLWGGLVVGMGLGLRTLDQYGLAIQAMQKSDYLTAQAALEVPSNATFPEEQIDAFAERVTAEWGMLQGFPQGVGAYGKAYWSIDFGLSAVGLAENKGISNPMPVPARFDKGVTTVILVFGDGPMPGSSQPRLAELGVQAGDGSMIWLSDFERTPPP